MSLQEKTQQLKNYEIFFDGATVAFPTILAHEKAILMATYLVTRKVVSKLFRENPHAIIAVPNFILSIAPLFFLEYILSEVNKAQPIFDVIAGLCIELGIPNFLPEIIKNLPETIPDQPNILMYLILFSILTLDSSTVLASKIKEKTSK